VIKTLLRENGTIGLDDESIVHIAAEIPETPPSNDVRSPETYVGYSSAENFAWPERSGVGFTTERHFFREAHVQWMGTRRIVEVAGEKGTLESVPGKIVFRFHARDLHMVVGLAKNGQPVRFNIKLNGAAPGDDHGLASATDGAGEVRQARTYQPIRQKGPIKDVTFEIEFLDPVSRPSRSHLAN
jgi:hypothetical protein